MFFIFNFITEVLRDISMDGIINVQLKALHKACEQIEIKWEFKLNINIFFCCAMLDVKIGSKKKSE